MYLLKSKKTDVVRVEGKERVVGDEVEELVEATSGRTLTMEKMLDFLLGEIRSH